MSDPYDKLIAAQRGAHASHFAPATVQEVMTVVRVERDSTQRAKLIVGSINGDGEFPIVPNDKDAEPGDRVLVDRPVTAQSGAVYSLLSVIESGTSSPLLIPGTAIPAPEFADPPLDFDTTLVAAPGIIGARAVIRFDLIEAKYAQSATLVFYAISGSGEFSVERVAVPNTEVTLSRVFEPGTDIDVYLRAESNAFRTPGLESPINTYALAVNDGDPGTVTGMTVATDAHGALVIVPVATLDATFFDRYRYEISASPTGTSPTVIESPGPLTYAGTAGIRYIRIRAVSKAGTLGQAYPIPPANWSGPYTIVGSFIPDTTAPAVMPAPTLTPRTVQYGDGTVHGYITIVIPGSYTFAADHKRTQFHVVVDNGQIYDLYLEGTATTLDQEVGFGQFTISARAEDTSGNTQTTFGASTVATVVAPATPTGTPTLTTQAIGAGLIVRWTPISDAIFYNVQRANDNVGTGAVGLPSLVSNATDPIESLFLIDPLRGTTDVTPTFFYRVRAINFAGNGPWSAWVSGTAGKLDALNLRPDSIVASLVAADNAIFNKILAGAVQTGLFSTDASPATRIEIHGNGVTNPNEIRFIENLLSVQYKRMVQDGTGITVFGDAVQGDVKMYRHTDGRGRFDAHNLQIMSTGMRVAMSVADLYFDQAVSGMGNWRLGYVKDSAGNDRLGLVEGGTGAELLLGFDPGRGSVMAGASPYLSINGGGIGFNKSSVGYGGTLGWDASGIIAASLRLRGAGGLSAGAMPSYVSAWPSTVMQATSLGLTGGNTQPLAAWQQSTGNLVTTRMQSFRGQTVGGLDWQDARTQIITDVDNNSVVGGGVELGFRAYAPFAGFRLGATLRQYWDSPNSRWQMDTGLNISGALSKTSGSFVIPHPDPAKTATRDLRHCFVEGPTAGENLYTYVVGYDVSGEFAVADSEGKAVRGATMAQDAKNGAASVSIPLPDYWPFLNERPRVIATEQGDGDGFGIAKGKVSADLTTLTVRMSEPGEYAIVLIGTRKDEHAVAWWNRRGVEKGRAQLWTNDSTIERRAARRDRPQPRTTIRPVAGLHERGTAWR